MKKSLYSAAALALLATGMTSCQSDDLGANSGKQELLTVKMTAGVGIAKDETRTVLTPDASGNLKCTWDDDDQVLVTAEWGKPYGAMKISDGVGESFAHFDGVLVGVPADTKKLRFHYMGNKVVPTEWKYSETETQGSGEYLYDYSNQTGTSAALTDYDFMIGTSEVSVADGYAYTENMNLKRAIAFGRFELQFPAGVTRTNEPVYISGENVYTQIKVSTSFKILDNGSLDPGAAVSKKGKGTITVTGREDKDIYVAIIPVAGIAPTFTCTIGGKEYTGSLDARDWKASDYKRKTNDDGTFSGVPVVMKAKVTGADHSKNPLLNWAESDLVCNQRGASTVSTFTDSPYERGSFYQFGRNYGYNSESAAASSYALETQIPARYGFRNAYPGTGSTSPVTVYDASKSLSAYTEMFFVGDSKLGDYKTPRYGETWAERAKSNGYTNSTPCPEGWTIPTVADFKEILPLVNGATGFEGFDIWDTGYSQIKTLNDGVTKCAFRWSGWYDDVYNVYFMRIEAQVVDDNTKESALTDEFWESSNTVVRDFSGFGYIFGPVTSGTVGSQSQLMCRPVTWGKYSFKVYSYQTLRLYRVTSYMREGGFYWTSDAVQGTMNFIFNNEVQCGYDSGVRLSQFASSIACSIRPIKAK